MVALIDLAIGVDLKAGKNVDALQIDKKIIAKNLGTSTTRNSIVEVAKKGELPKFEINVNGKKLTPDPNFSSGAAVYKGATTEDVYDYFKQVAGIRTLPNSEKMAQVRCIDMPQVKSL